MTNKAVRYRIVGVAVVLLVAVTFAGAVSAGDISIANADEWIWNVSNGTFASMKAGETINLTGDLDFSGKDQSKVMISSFKGKIEGYDGSVCHTISNFSISGSSKVGLIGNYAGSKISNLTISNFSVSGSDNVGGLVGYANGESAFENVIVMNGDVTGSGSNTGGLVSCTVDMSKEIVNCTVKNCRVSGSYGVGGLVGGANGGSVSVNASWVNGCDISASGNFAGGLVGYAYPASTKIDLKNSEVVNCVVKSGTGYSGGCLGYNEYKEGDVHGVDNCTVRNCAIYTMRGSLPCGGVIGGCVTGTNPTVYPKVSNCTVEFCTIAGQGTNPAGGIAGTFPTAGTLDRNKVISSCIVSVSGKAAGICPTATTAS